MRGEVVGIVAPTAIMLLGSFTAAEILLKAPGAVGWGLAVVVLIASGGGAVAFAVHGTKRTKGGRDE